MPFPYEKKKYTTDPVTGVDIVAPFNCDTVVLKNLGSIALRYRTDSADVNTEDTVDGFGQETLTPARFHHVSGGHGYRFQTGTVVAHVWSASGAPNFLVTFIA